jgi:hypothetical protein
MVPYRTKALPLGGWFTPSISSSARSVAGGSTWRRALKTPITQPEGMTPKELEILEALSCTDVETFLPAGRSAPQAQAFDELVELLQGMQRLRWIELEVGE